MEDAKLVALCPLSPPSKEVNRQETATILRLRGQRLRVRGGRELRRWREGACDHLQVSPS